MGSHADFYDYINIARNKEKEFYEATNRKK